MTSLPHDDLPKAQLLRRASEAAARQIPPAWPLSATVAVNPFLGQSTESLAETAARMERTGGIAVTMQRDWYLERIADGRIADADLAAALDECAHDAKPVDIAGLKRAASQPAPAPQAVPTVADLAAASSGTDWPAIVTDRIGVWAAGHFDRGQALWAAPAGRTAWDSWRAFASRDLTPEILGLTGFAATVTATPDDRDLAMAGAVRRLGLEPAALEGCFHRLLMTLGGWAQYARQLQWQAELAGGTDRTLVDLLAIRLVWDEALMAQYPAEVAPGWAVARTAHAQPLAPSPAQVVDTILQEAVERAGQRRLATTLATARPDAAQAAAHTADPAAPLPVEARAAVQAAFCIDVRSEVFRRALESADPAIRTLGFAGFFGLRVDHRRFASDTDEARLPVLLSPALASRGTPDTGQAQADDLAARYRARATRAWGRFKLAAVSSFAFVEAAGPVYAAKLVRDALSLPTATAPSEPAPRLDPPLASADAIDAAETVLRAMSLTGGFARLVLLAGHGAQVVNNPHASALQCGACGGYSGEVNARLLAGLLNDPAVREGLTARGIDVPADTLFVAGLHDTTSDTVTLYDGDLAAPGHRADLARLRGWLADAGTLARAERALSLPGAAGGADLARRAVDWSEIRPEWALARCSAFIAAPRARTAGRDLRGRAFLHDYDWQPDGARGYPVLELILTAPVVVASWISLQYYGSTVAPSVFGGGNKLLGNVTGGIGVTEGNGGPLRTGLPWQSVHDGEGLVHEPLRLSVCVEAPTEAITDILSRHDGVRALFDNGWLHLLALDSEGRIAHRYAGGLHWTPVAEDGASAVPQPADAVA